MKPIIALAILNAVLISVLGRRREFGILQAMGLTGFETGSGPARLDLPICDMQR